MTDETKKPGIDEDGKTVTGKEAANDAADLEEMAEQEAADLKVEDRMGPLEILAAEADEWKDKYLRMAAEMDNLRRRTARDVKDAKAYSVSGFARDMLGVSDNLRRALDAVPAEARESEEAGLKALIEGVEMTERSMLSALERHGVKKLEPKGQKFDPNFHQAMFEVPDPQVANNTVVDVVQDGYVIGDRVLRPAMVGVAKGGPKQAEASSEPESREQK